MKWVQSLKETRSAADCTENLRLAGTGAALRGEAWRDAGHLRLLGAPQPRERAESSAPSGLMPVVIRGLFRSSLLCRRGSR